MSTAPEFRRCRNPARHGKTNVIRLIAKPKDALSGALFLALGVGFFYFASGYRLGTATQMGPGYFPLLLSGLLMLFGLVLIVRSFFGEREEFGTISLRATVPVLVGSLAFALLLYPAGLPLAVMTTVLIGVLAASDARPLQSIILAVVMAAVCILIFVTLLGQHIPLIGSWFQG